MGASRYLIGAFGTSPFLSNEIIFSSKSLDSSTFIIGRFVLIVADQCEKQKRQGSSARFCPREAVTWDLRSDLPTCSCVEPACGSRGS